MNYRLATVHARKSYTADTTEIIDLDVQDPISALIVELAVTNGASAAPTAHAIACLTKIELIDGADVLYSLSGYEAEGVDWYHNKKEPANWNPYLSGMDVQRFIKLNFGRWLWDPLLAFDPKKFRNPQLKLTLDINAGGVSASTNKLQAWAAIFDEKPIVPVGFLMHKQIKNYTLTASGHEYTDLPTDHPYRKLLIRQQTAGTEPNQLISNVKLTEDQDKRVVVDHGTEDILRTIAALSPPYKEQLYGYVGTTSTNGFCTPTTRVNGMAQRWALTTGAGEIAFYDGDGGRFKVIAATAASNMNLLAQGFLPHGVWEIPFGDQNDTNDWYDVTKVGSLKADITAASGASSSDSLQIFLQQLRRY